MSFLFFVLSVLLVASALGVVFFKNPIYSALCLIVNLLGVAGLYAMLNAHLLATVQIIVYAGAIMVLVVFVIMLLNLKQESGEPTGFGSIALASIFCVVFCCVLGVLLTTRFGVNTGMVTATHGTVKELGRLIFGRYAFTFEAASILIMAAIVGAATLARRPRGSAKIEG